MKLVGRGHGQLAPKEAPLLPWREVAVDLIGPWEIDIEQAWLARYPMPQDIIYDQGTEFTGQHFQHSLSQRPIQGVLNFDTTP